MNSTLFQSKSGKGINVETENTKTKKREEEKKNKGDPFCVDCFGSHRNDDWTQGMFPRKCDSEIAVNIGLPVFWDEGCARLTSDFE
jgi:hypothetical protein